MLVWEYQKLNFSSAIGELRGVFDIMIGEITKAYGLDVGDDLVQIILE